MRILQLIIAFMPSTFGGMKNHLYYQAKELIKRGHEVTVFTSDAYSMDKNHHRLKPKVINGIKVVYFSRVCMRFFSAWFITPSMISALKRSVKKFDLVHMQSYRTFQNVVAYWYCKKYKIPYVLSAGGSIKAKGAFIWFKHLFDPIIGKRLLKDAKYLIALTNTEAQEYKDQGIKASKIKVIPNAVDTDEIPKKSRSRFNLPDNYILFLGRIHEIKGLPFLLRSIARLKDVHLVIAGGDHGYLAKTKELVSSLGLNSRVTFTGFVKGDDKWQLYLNAGVFVLSSRSEAFGNVVPEAMYCGCPVIVSDTCDIARTIRSEGIGTVVKYRDEKALALSISKILSDSDLRKKLSLKGKRFVKDHWTWPKVVDSLEDIYKR